MQMSHSGGRRDRSDRLVARSNPHTFFNSALSGNFYQHQMTARSTLLMVKLFIMDPCTVGVNSNDLFLSFRIKPRDRRRH